VEQNNTDLVKSVKSTHNYNAYLWRSFSISSSNAVTGAIPNAITEEKSTGDAKSKENIFQINWTTTRNGKKSLLIVS
jgi:hypothetical protein